MHLGEQRGITYLPCGVVSCITMVRAFIMVKTAAGKSEELSTAIRAETGVEEAHIVAGKYDIIAEVVGSEVYDVMQSVSTGIRDLDGVVDTRTYISLD
jgi:DNA-binding Lrp family transcriptional regulator